MHEVRSSDGLTEGLTVDLCRWNSIVLLSGCVGFGEFRRRPPTVRLASVNPSLERTSCMFHVLLFEPEIPPNTGNIIRLCANTNSELHLIEPLGFSLDEPRLRRAGLDYQEWARVQIHPSLMQCIRLLGYPRLFAFSTRGQGFFSNACFQPGDALLFGPETRGLPVSLLNTLPAAHCLRIPMMAGNRSLNLSNAVAVAVYEAWRQNEFHGCNQ